jgi:hypothetical protein
MYPTKYKSKKIVPIHKLIIANVIRDVAVKEAIRIRSPPTINGMAIRMQYLKISFVLSFGSIKEPSPDNSYNLATSLLISILTRNSPLKTIKIVAKERMQKGRFEPLRMFLIP